MNIPLVDLHAQFASIRNEVEEAIRQVVHSANFIGGVYVKNFEEEFAAFCGMQYAIGVSNGTDALRLALLASGVKSGDDVITVPNTFIATTEAISMIGAKPRFVDVEEDSYNLDPLQLGRALTPRTRAIIPVHLYGRPANMDAILAFAKLHNLKVIADAAQAHGALYRNQPIGLYGDAVCFSFYPGKNLGAYGDAGAVVTNNEEIATKIRKLRDHGRAAKYEHLMEGFNCRMDALQAAILSVKLKYLPEWTRRRQLNAKLYDGCLGKMSEIGIPSKNGEGESVYHLYIIRTAHRSSLQQHLEKRGVSTGIHYPIPLHLQSAYSHLKLQKGSFPRAEMLADEILSLPMFPELAEDQIAFVSQTIMQYLESYVPAA